MKQKVKTKVLPEHKKARKSVRFDPHLLNTLLENAPVIVGFHDKDNRVLWANKAYRKITGLSLQKLQGKKCYDAWHLGKICKTCPVVKALKKGSKIA